MRRVAAYERVCASVQIAWSARLLLLRSGLYGCSIMNIALPDFSPRIFDFIASARSGIVPGAGRAQNAADSS
eukprot:IDg19115t1